MDFHHGRKLSRSWGHVLHCMDSLRQDVICNADDTPRVTNDDPKPDSGQGQMLQCRSFDKLNAWAREYSACFKAVNQTDEIPDILRFTYSPEGSPFNAKIVEECGEIPHEGLER